MVAHLGHAVPVSVPVPESTGSGSAESGGEPVAAMHTSWALGKKTKTNANFSLVSISIEHALTFTSRDTIGPSMIKVRVPRISTLLVPSTITIAATELTRFLPLAALGTSLAACRRCTRRHRCFCVHIDASSAAV